MNARDAPRHPRLTPARGDLAAASLRGVVEAERYVEGETFTVTAEVADLKRAPRPDAPLDTQLLFGEAVTVYEDENGWAWVQAERDLYVGYVATHALVRGRRRATHRVTTKRTFVYPAADMKQPILGAIPLDGRVLVEEIAGGFARTADHAFVFAAHLAPLDDVVPDYVEAALRLLGSPYLWGGRSPLGIDCSGLVQLAASLAGYAVPRDTDMQAAVGEGVPVDRSLQGLLRGDLVFWTGHVGIMLDAETLLHANAHHMLVAREPLVLARDRIAATGGNEIVTARRFTGVLGGISRANTRC